MARVEVTKYPGIIAWIFNARYLAYCGNEYGSSNSETKAIKKALRVSRRPTTYYVEVTE